MNKWTVTANSVNISILGQFETFDLAVAFANAFPKSVNAYATKRGSVVKNEKSWGAVCITLSLKKKTGIENAKIALKKIERLGFEIVYVENSLSMTEAEFKAVIA